MILTKSGNSVARAIKAGISDCNGIDANKTIFNWEPQFNGTTAADQKWGFVAPAGYVEVQTVKYFTQWILTDGGTSVWCQTSIKRQDNTPLDLGAVERLRVTSNSGYSTVKSPLFFFDQPTPLLVVFNPVFNVNPFEFHVEISIKEYQRVKQPLEVTI